MTITAAWISFVKSIVTEKYANRKQLRIFPRSPTMFRGCYYDDREVSELCCVRIDWVQKKPQVDRLNAYRETSRETQTKIITIINTLNRINSSGEPTFTVVLKKPTPKASTTINLRVTSFVCSIVSTWTQKKTLPLLN